MTTKVDGYKEALVIDRDSLGECLIEQPQLYYDVTSAHVAAVALRDAAKLDLEEVHARQDKAIRADADAAQTKITEARIQQEIHLDPKYKAKRLELLELTEAADQMLSLKEAYQQRSFMLRELVALHISERADIGAASGTGQLQPYGGARATVLQDEVDKSKRATAPARQAYRVRGRK